MSQLSFIFWCSRRGLRKAIKGSTKKAAQNPHIVLHGKYPAGQIPPLVVMCDVSLHLSLVPKTYVLTLSEAWMLSLVPIVTKIGALGEGVSDGINGIKIPVRSSTDLIKTLLTLVSYPSKLTTLRKPVADLPLSWMPGHITDLGNLYQRLLQAPKALQTQENSFEQGDNDTSPLMQKWARFPIPSLDSHAQPRTRSMLCRLKERLGAWLKRI